MPGRPADDNSRRASRAARRASVAPSEGDFIQDRPTPPPAGAASPRPEWLVGADEGLVAEPGGAPDPALERPRLRRLDEGPEGSSPPRAPGLVGNELSQQAPAPPAPSGARKIESRGAIDSEAPMTYGMADAFMNGSPAPGPRKRSSFAEPEVEDLPVVRKRPVRAMVRVESSRGEAKNPLLELLG